jgi:5-methylcytosine-specific restriction endonuclease McrA
MSVRQILTRLISRSAKSNGLRSCATETWVFPWENAGVQRLGNNTDDGREHCRFYRMLGCSRMKNDNDKLKKIFAKTDGHCHLTGQKLSFGNYGDLDGHGAWVIDHSVPLSKGGTDHMNNLFPASISANRSKGNTSSQAIRAQDGLTHPPLSKEQATAVAERNAWKGLAAGAAIGLPFGPIGIGVLALLGALIGSESETK